ncbi:hypothetical protein ATANTOWER_006505 [Ataeniobius toweri]|uniref:Uncharacterized protein n=1 Tax=Ataeniobius toweri TaxID=208326 RepID=A0ABU7BFQ4_9TELE|nr:hypothetical protein [Ataeniobius toweri]
MKSAKISRRKTVDLHKSGSSLGPISRYLKVPRSAGHCGIEILSHIKEIQVYQQQSERQTEACSSKNVITIKYRLYNRDEIYNIRKNTVQIFKRLNEMCNLVGGV